MSVGDLEVDMKLKMSNYEDTVRQLDIYYGIGKQSSRAPVNDTIGNTHFLYASWLPNPWPTGVLLCRVTLRNTVNFHRLNFTSLLLYVSSQNRAE